MTEQQSHYQRQLARNAAEARAGLGGMLAARPGIGAVALVTLPVMAVFGEGDYIIAVMAALYAGLFVYGVRLRRRAELGSVKRSQGFWLAFYSFLFSVLLGAMAITFLFQPGGWR